MRKRQKTEEGETSKDFQVIPELINGHDKIKPRAITSSQAADILLGIEAQLSDELKALQFSPPVEYIYNPLEYASQLHETFVRKFFKSESARIIFLGMNPGPWGMSQTGIPFGENKVVKEWFQVSGSVGHPEKEHPSRKIAGLKCHRTEVSGKKFWGLFRQICGNPENFFRYSFVYNICPLQFMTNTGKNITPAELKKTDLKQLNEICDKAFLQVITKLNVKVVIGIGKFAEKCAIRALKNGNLSKVQVASIPHPSPCNVKNHMNWSEETVKKLDELNLLQHFKND